MESNKNIQTQSSQMRRLRLMSLHQVQVILTAFVKFT